MKARQHHPAGRHLDHGEHSSAADAAEAAALARHETRRWLDRHSGHLVRALAVAVEGRAWARVRGLAHRVAGVGLVGELADAELVGDVDRVRELERAVRSRRAA